MEEENAIRFFKSILYFIEEKSFFLQIMLGGNNVVKGCKRVEGFESRLVSKFIGKHKYIDIHRTLFFIIDSNFVECNFKFEFIQIGYFKCLVCFQIEYTRITSISQSVKDKTKI